MPKGNAGFVGKMEDVLDAHKRPDDPKHPTTGVNGPLRALHIFASLNRGGAETWLMDVVRSTSRAELQIDVCLIGAAGGLYEEEFERLGGRILRCPLGRNPWGFARRLTQLLTAERYDIVHSHVYYFSGVILRSAARAGVAKRIAHIHPAEDRRNTTLSRRLYVKWMRRWIGRYGTRFVGPTKASLEGFWGPGWEADPGKRVIYNGIRTERFVRPVNRAEVRSELGIPENAPLVLNVSRFAPHKRHEFLVNVAGDVLAQRDDVYFLLIGAGALRESVEARVRAKGLTDHFRFISGLPDIDRYWMSADVFAFPSCNEGFGIVVVEAAAAGLPVIAQDIPGVREAVDACAEATLLPLDTSAADWARVLTDALKTPRISESQRQARLRRFPFTLSASIEALRNLYAE